MTPDTPKRSDANDCGSSDHDSRTDRSDAPSKMGGVDHTHPHRNTTFGSIFGRGPSIAADGGEPASGGRSSSGRRSDGGEPAATPEGGEFMEDVDHDAPSETGANATFGRGDEQTGAATVDTGGGANEATDE